MKKRFLAIITAMALVLSMIVPTMAQENSDVSFKIVHTNDVHARVDGEAFVSSYVKSLKEAGEHVFLVSAGDVLHGLPLATISTGKAIVDIMNITGYDFLTPGNHDFNFGTEKLIELSKTMNFDVLSANVLDASTGESVFQGYSVKEVQGVKVGFFGLATPETSTKTNPKNVAGYKFEDPVSIAIEMVEVLKAEGCQIIIAIAHLGVDEETLENQRSEAVAKVDGVDIVIDGHSHTVMEKGTKVEGGALIAQTGEYLENIGVVEVNFSGGQIVSSASLIKTPTADSPGWGPDTNVIDVIERENKANEAIIAQTIGKTPVKLDGEREDVRTKETNLSALLTSAMLSASGADIAITNGGGIRASIEAGEITKGDVLKVLPYGNFICTVNLKGRAVIEALELGLGAYPESAGGFSQVGGIKVTFDSTKAAGSRVVSVTLSDGTPIDPEKTYKVATNDFMVAGGDKYTMLNVSDGYIEFGALDEALIEYISSGVDIATIELGAIVDIAEGDSSTETAPVPATTDQPSPNAHGSENIVAKATSSTVFVNGEEVSFQAYNIADNNYFMLRDIAYAINGSEKQFSLDWDAATSVIAITSGYEYIPAGNELETGDNSDKTAVFSNAGVTLDGETVVLFAYNINGNNYFKLRDIGASIDFGVSWDEANNAISIITAEPYVQ